jgi:ribulose 1,5-bisphosphate synthetase/thiazole synthase
MKPLATTANTDALRRAIDELTLRDHLACAALAAIIAVEGQSGLTAASMVAEKAYRVAEAMLAERAARADAD